MHIHSNIVRGIPIHFTINHCYFKNYTPDEKNGFYGTAQVVIQKSTSNTSFPIKINRSTTKFKGDFPHIGKIANQFHNMSQSQHLTEKPCAGNKRATTS